MKYIIVQHSTSDGKWYHNEHPEFGVYRSSRTAERKLRELVALGELPPDGIGMGTVEIAKSNYPISHKTDDCWPVSPDVLREIIRNNK